jgi:capsule polysaccharide modification protein KpsS
MDRAYREYGLLMRRLARRHRLGDRLVYVHDLHLPTLLQHAKGTITINSTVGLSSIHHGTPVKVLGTAIYDMPGLTHQGSLAHFLHHPGSVDRTLYQAFRSYLLAHNQANGSVWRRIPGRGFGTGVRWFGGSPE